MVYQEYQVSYMRSSNDWKLPLNLAIGFHIMVALTAVYLPLLFESKPKFTDVYTVNLVNMSEPAAAPAAAPAPAPVKAPPKAPPKMIEKTADPVKIPPKTQTAPIAEAKPEEAAPPAPPKAISLRPVKKKVKNKVVPPDDTVKREQEKREKEIERVKRQQLAESLRAEQTAAEEARLAAEEAEAERKAHGSHPGTPGGDTVPGQHRHRHSDLLHLKRWHDKRPGRSVRRRCRRTCPALFSAAGNQDLRSLAGHRGRDHHQ